MEVYIRYEVLRSSDSMFYRRQYVILCAVALTLLGMTAPLSHTLYMAVSMSHEAPSVHGSPMAGHQDSIQNGMSDSIPVWTAITPPRFECPYLALFATSQIADVTSSPVASPAQTRGEAKSSCLPEQWSSATTLINGVRGPPGGRNLRTV
jgi:hypothetical protein